MNKDLLGLTFGHFGVNGGQENDKLVVVQVVGVVLVDRTEDGIAAIDLEGDQ